MNVRSATPSPALRNHILGAAPLASRSDINSISLPYLGKAVVIADAPPVSLRSLCLLSVFCVKLTRPWTEVRVSRLVCGTAGL